MSASLPIKEIVQTLQQVPNQVAQPFAHMLSQLMLDFVSISQKSLMHSQELDQLTAMNTKRKNPRVPFEVGRSDRLTGNFNPDTDMPKNKIGFGS